MDKGPIIGLDEGSAGNWEQPTGPIIFRNAMHTDKAIKIIAYVIKQKANIVV